MLLLYAVTDQAWVGKQTFLGQIEAALKGGAAIVQLREKKLDEDGFVLEAILVRDLCHKDTRAFMKPYFKHGAARIGQKQLGERLQNLNY